MDYSGKYRKSATRRNGRDPVRRWGGVPYSLGFLLFVLLAAGTVAARAQTDERMLRLPQAAQPQQPVRIPGGGSWGGSGDDVKPPSSMATVPQLVGAQLSGANFALSERRLTVGEVGYRQSREPDGTIIQQRPEAGTKVPLRSAVDLTVSRQIRNRNVTVPDLRWKLYPGVTLAITEPGLVVGNIGYRQSSYADNTVLAQDPLPGRQVERGTPVNLTLSRYVRPQPQYRLQLSAWPNRVKPGDTVTLTARLEPQPGRTPVRYDFTVDGRPLASAQTHDSFSHRFPQPGSYRVRASARPPDSREPVHSNEAVVVVEPQERPPLAARLEPSRPRVEQGTPVVFLGTAIDAVGAVTYRWEGPAGVRHGREYRVDTARLGSGRHAVQLTVGDGRQQQAVARTFVEVVPPHEARRVSVRIHPSRLTVTQGDAALFQAESDPPGIPLDYRWSGPRGMQASGVQFAVPTAGLAAGSYPVDLTGSNPDHGSADDRAWLEVRIDDERPTAVIHPPRAEVPAGGTASFDGAASRVPTGNPAFRWEGPLGQGSAASRFQVRTEGLDPGLHDVVLTVTDRQGRSDSARATLRILAPSLLLSADRRDLRPGETAVFRGTLEPDPGAAPLELYLDGERLAASLRSGEPVAHRFDRPGRYRLWLTAEIAGRPLNSPPVDIRVAAIPDWGHWLWTVPLLLLVGVAGLVLRRPPPRTARRPEGLDTRVRLRREQGDVDAAVPEGGARGLRLVLVIDHGVQKLESDRGG